MRVSQVAELGVPGDVLRLVDVAHPVPGSVQMVGRVGRVAGAGR
ncbi:hypothetical protein ABZ863_08805 [Saccharomonospora sp. NPDC046836]